jgi:hypothetical protein
MSFWLTYVWPFVYEDGCGIKVPACSVTRE